MQPSPSGASSLCSTNRLGFRQLNNLHERSGRIEKKKLKRIIKKTTKAAPRIQTAATRIGKLDFEMGVPTTDTVANMPRGMDYWKRLAAFIQSEPTEDRDRFFVAMLRPLGIEKGKPFAPDKRQTRVTKKVSEESIDGKTTA